MMINISSSQYQLSKGTVTLIEMTPTLLDEIESAISDPLRPLANWAKMWLGANDWRKWSLRTAVCNDVCETRSNGFAAGSDGLASEIPDIVSAVGESHAPSRSQIG